VKGVKNALMGPRMKSIIIILLLLSPIQAHSAQHSMEEWVSRYISPCPKIPDNRVCFDKTKRNFKRMLKHKSMILKHLDEYNLPGWLSTIPFIESEYTPDAISRAGAVGMWQIMPANLVYYLTTKWNGINYNYQRSPKLSHAIKTGKNAEEKKKTQK